MKKVKAFVRISDGRVFDLLEDGNFGIPKSTNSYSLQRLSIKEFLPIFDFSVIEIYSNYFKNCGENSDYIPECEVCGMSYYTCLCSHDD